MFDPYPDEPCVICDGDWDELIDGHLIVGGDTFHACISCIINMENKDWDEEDYLGLLV